MVLNIYLFSTLLTFSLLILYQFCRGKYLCVHQHNCLSFFPPTYLSCSLNLFWHVLPLLNSSGLKVSFCSSIWILRKQQDRCVLESPKEECMNSKGVKNYESIRSSGKPNGLSFGDPNAAFPRGSCDSFLTFLFSHISAAEMSCL